MGKSNGNGNGSAGVGHNSAPTLREQGKAFVERVERLNEAIEFEREKMMEQVAMIRSDIKQVLGEAKSAGIKGAVTAAVRARKLVKKADSIREGLDIADRDTFDNIRLALGDLAELPLGKAALGEADATVSAAAA